jgi:penicillin amidase
MATRRTVRTPTPKGERSRQAILEATGRLIAKHGGNHVTLDQVAKECGSAKESEMTPSPTIWRDQNGVPHVEADTAADLSRGMGIVHATDRGMQMLLMRILGQGRASEILDSSDETLAIDIFFRKANWFGDTDRQFDRLSDDHQKRIEAYCDGVNAVFAKKLPWELKLLGCRHEPWTPADCIMLMRMLGYLTLSESQDHVEHFIVEMVQKGIPETHLQELFPGHLKGLDMELLQKVTLPQPLIPASVKWNLPLPRMMASNNWVVSGAKTKSGRPILSNDPHLEVNRLPCVWAEMVVKYEKGYMAGGTMPGIPGVLSGRSGTLSWGVTYPFLDGIDSWVEKCKEGRFYREEGDEWQSFGKRVETIKRKKKDPVDITFYENRHGVLDGDPSVEGYYLATRWAPGDSGAAAFTALFDLWTIETVQEAMDCLGRIETAWNWVLADTQGNIGYQMSGLAPRRRDGVSGLIPLPGWKAENDWRGFHDPADLPRVLNPEKGFFATANEDMGAFGTINPANMPMGPYRANRINQLLASKDQVTVEDCYEMHFDLYSLEAEAFMAILSPLLPDTSQGRMLKEWDLCYTAESKGAFLFEAFLKGLYREVFGRLGAGEEVIDYLAEETGIFVDFYENFNRVLLAESSVWFDGRTREEIYQKVAAEALAIPPQPWGQSRQFTFSHVLFGGKLPGFLGFDRGPIPAIGSRATIHQGQIYRSGGRVTTFYPSFRIVSDLSESHAFSNLAGGPSDRRFSKWYVSDVENWRKGTYKKLTADGNPTRQAFP